MNTIKVTVNSNADAQLLISLLKNMNMVEHIEMDSSDKVVTKNQYQELQDILAKHASADLFKKIENPVEWQKKIRDEWQ